MKQNKTNKRFFQGAFILTLAGIISKVLSAAYRIPLQNITGDKGFYIYQQVYPFLGIAMMLALYGFPVAMSKIIVEETDSGEKRLKLADFQQFFVVLALFSGSIAILLVISAPTIAKVMGDIALAPSIRMTAGVFLIVPIVSSYRGFFQGHHQMKPTALSQVMEQIIRVTVIIGCSIIVVYYHYPLYYIGIGGAIASCAGAIAAAILLYIHFRKAPNLLICQQAGTIDFMKITRSLLGLGIVIAINHMLLLLFQFVDAFTLVSGLIEQSILLKEAQVLKGVFDRGQPLVQLGIVLGSSLALALIPVITSDRRNKQVNVFLPYIRSAWKFSLYLSVGASIGLITIYPHVNRLLFQSNDGTTSLQVLSLTIIFASLSITTAAILQGLGYMSRTAGIVLLGVGIKVLLNLVLVPLFGIMGSALATSISAGFVLLGNVYLLKRILGKQFIQIPWLRFSMALSAMVLVLVLINQVVYPIVLLESRFVYAIYVVVTIIIGSSSYFYFLLRLRAFTEDEIDVLPFQDLVRYIAKEDKHGSNN